MDPEVLIKIAADIASAINGLTQVIQSVGGVGQAIEDVENQQEGSDQATKGFFETWLSGFDQSKSAAEMWGKQMSDAFDSIKKGVGDAVMSLPSLVANTAAAGEEMQTLSNRLNVSVEDLAELKFIADQSNVPMEGLARTVQTLTTTLVSGEGKQAKAIESLGFNLKELAKDPKQAMITLLDTIQKTVPVAEQGAKAIEVFGSRFRTQTGILKEDIPALVADFEKLGKGMTGDLAAAGEEYGDMLGRIQLVQDNFRNQIAGALLPTLNDLLETMPNLGGAVLTVGSALKDTAASFLPLLGNIALMKSAGMLTWATGASAGVGGVTTAVAGLTAVLGPLAIAIGGVAAAWKVWQGANAESGWIRELSDSFEYASLRMQGFSEAEADAAIATQHATQRAQELAAAQKNLAKETTGATNAADASADRWEMLANNVKLAQQQYAALTKDQKEKIRAALETMNPAEIAKVTGASVEAIELYKKALDRAADASKKHAEQIKKTAEEREKAAKEMFALEAKISKENSEFAAKAIKENDARLKADREYYNKKYEAEIEAIAREQEALEARQKAQREYYNWVGERQMEEAAKQMEAAEKAKNAWKGALGEMANAWSQLATITGASKNAIVSGIGEMIGTANTMVKSWDAAKTGITSGLDAFRKAGAAGGNLFSQLAAGLPSLLTGIGGIISAAQTAIAMGKKMWDAFTRSPGEAAAKEIGRDFGVAISEEMGNAFAATADKLFKGDRFAAHIFHLKDIITEAGGITEANFTPMLARLHDVFSMVETGKFTVGQATQVLNENFAAFAEHLKASGGEVTTEILEIIQLQERFGTRSQAVMDFVAANADKLSGAISGGIPDAFDRAAQAGVEAAETIGRATDDHINGTLKDTKDLLVATPWAQFAGRGAAAGSAVGGAMNRAGDAVAGVDRSLDNTPWGAWADAASAAAAEAQAAIDAVSFGSSPGGIKEIPLKLAEAVRAFRAFERIGVGSADSVKQSLDAMQGVNVGVSAAANVATSSHVDAADAMAGGFRENVALTFKIYSFDAKGVEDAVEKQILPMMTATLSRGRGLRDLKAALGLS